MQTHTSPKFTRKERRLSSCPTPYRPQQSARRRHDIRCPIGERPGALSVHSHRGRTSTRTSLRNPGNTRQRYFRRLGPRWWRDRAYTRCLSMPGDAGRIESKVVRLWRGFCGRYRYRRYRGNRPLQSGSRENWC